MGDSDNNDGKGIHGLVEGKCRHCGKRIPEDTLACPGCGKERLFDQGQYDMLQQCSQAEDMSEWNRWREENVLEPVHLEGANLMWHNLNGAILRDAKLKGADFHWAHMEGANLIMADLEGANLQAAYLEGARFASAHLKGANLIGADLKGADLGGATLKGAVAAAVHVDTGTNLWGCTCDERTYFVGVSLDTVTVEPSFKALLERNVRHIGWKRWYRSSWAHRWLFSLPVRAFWWTSDYGSSTARILLVFLLLSAAFAYVYYRCELVRAPGLVTDLSEVAGQPVPALLMPLRALYFSVVTMTTLGFGDIHAYPQSYAGHLLLMAQVMLGYILLGALITRFAIMFQGTTVPYVSEVRKQKGYERWAQALRHLRATFRKLVIRCRSFLHSGR